MSEGAGGVDVPKALFYASTVIVIARIAKKRGSTSIVGVAKKE